MINKLLSNQYPCVIDFMVCTKDVPITAKLTPSIYCSTSMWVYSDILELSALGDTQAPCFRYLPIQSVRMKRAIGALNHHITLKLKNKR